MTVWTERKLANLAKRILRRLKVRGTTLDIFLLPHKEITSLKRRFIKKMTEPNVLSFPEPQHFPHPEVRKKKYLGEVYLNKDIVRRSPHRAAPLLLHGVLHLMGYDHRKKNEAAKMERLEAKVLSGLR